MTFDISKMSLEELAQLKEAVNKRAAEIITEKQEELAKAQAAFELVGGETKVSAPRRQRAAPEPKYRSEKDPSVTWSGRGANPKWLIAEMEETGKPKEAFLIKDSGRQ